MGESLRDDQRKQKREFVKLIYKKVQTEVELNTIFEQLKIAYGQCIFIKWKIFLKNCTLIVK